MEPDKVSIWPRTEPFLLGALPVAPPSKLGIYYLRKMVTYVRTRDGCFPTLSWAMWKHIACGKLQLTEDLAWLYFETFDLLVGHPPEEKLEWAECLFQCSTSKELDRQRSKLSVDTLQFILFLYIQQLSRVSLRTSLLGEEWPSPRTSSACSDREAKTSSQNKRPHTATYLSGQNSEMARSTSYLPERDQMGAGGGTQNWDDQAHLSFVQSHLCELLELLVEPGQLSDSGKAIRDSKVSLEAMQGLSLLLEGSMGHGRSVYPVHKLLLKDPLQGQAGFSKLTRSFPLHQLLTCLRNNLIFNPFGMTNCLRSGKKMAWAQQVEGAMKRAKIARNTHLAPPGSRMVLMSQVFKQTLAKDSDKLVGANIKIHRCSSAFIYLLSPVRSVSVDKCHNSTVVLGPVETSVHIHGCENVRVVCVAARIVVSSSSHCSVHTLTPTRPLLLPGSTDITLGPFPTYYPSLEDHMAAVGLAVVPNVWDQPLVLGAEGLIHSSTTTNPDPGCFRLLPPKEFQTMVVPFKMEGDTCEMPGELPAAYQAVLEEKHKSVEKWQRTVAEAHLNKEQQGQLRDLVEQRFHTWLLETGHIQELDGLKPCMLSCQRPPSEPSGSKHSSVESTSNGTKHVGTRRAIVI